MINITFNVFFFYSLQTCEKFQETIRIIDNLVIIYQNVRSRWQLFKGAFERVIENCIVVLSNLSPFLVVVLRDHVEEPKCECVGR